MPDPKDPQKSVPDPVPDPTVDPTEPIVDPTEPVVPAVQNPLELKLEGDGIPEKLKGKTVQEALTMLTESEGELTKATTESKQWQTFFSKQVGAPVTNPNDVTRQQQQQTPKYDPMQHLDEETAQAVGFIVGSQLNPIYEGLGAIFKEMTKSTRPDYDEHAERTEAIYKEMHPSYKFHPDYGFDYAYRLAKAEKMGPPKTEKLPQPGPSVGPTPEPKGPLPLTETEKYWADKQGLTVEEYRKFATPIDITKPMEGTK